MKKYNKILFVTTNSVIGGGELQLLYLAYGLKKQGKEVTVIIPGNGEFHDLLKAANINCLFIDKLTIKRLRGIPTFSLWSLFRLYRTIKKIKPELVHVYHYEVLKLTDLVCGILGVPCIWTCHAFWHVPRGFWGRYINRLTKYVTTVSEFSRAQIANGGSINKNKIDVIYNIIPEVFFNAKDQGNSLRARYSVKDDKIVVGIIGRMDPIKRHDLFVEAIHKAVKGNNRIFGLIVGGDLQEGDSSNTVKIIKEKINAYDLKDKILALPFQKDPIPAYDAVDILVVTSDGEAFCSAVVEAMVRGKPVISTACGGPQESIIDGETGYLVPVGDVDKMADKIIELAGDSEQRAKIGQNAKVHAKENYSQDKVISQYLKTYDKVFSAK